MKGMLEKRITLDLSSHGVQERISVRRGDALVHKIIITLVQDKLRVRPAGVEWAQVYALLPDGSTVSGDCTVLGSGAFEFIPGSGFFRQGGPVVCRLCLRGGDGCELFSPAFAMDTDGAFPISDAAIAEEYSKLEELLLQVLDAKRECESVAADIRAGDYSTPLSDASPLMNGAPSAGSSIEAARADHVHPNDTGRIKTLAAKTNIAPGDSIPFYSNTDKTEYRLLFGRLSILVRNSIPAETWTFTLSDGTTVTKEVLVK